VRTRFARLPLRIRLTLAFIGVMALVLAAGGFAIYTLFKADLDRTARGRPARPGRRRRGAAARRRRRRIGDSGEPYAQVFDPRGRVLATTRRAGANRCWRPASSPRRSRASA
jgi:hypothetical protein